MANGYLDESEGQESGRGTHPAASRFGYLKSIPEEFVRSIILSPSYGDIPEVSQPPSLSFLVVQSSRSRQSCFKERVRLRQMAKCEVRVSEIASVHCCVVVETDGPKKGHRFLIEWDRVLKSALLSAEDTLVGRCRCDER